MKNLEQLRAAAALQAAPGIKREAISKLPGLIINNGLLAAAAFCAADGDGPNRGDLQKAMLATAGHLAARKILTNGDSIKAMIEELAGRDSSVLQRATAEALAFLAFLKRFAEKKNG